MSSAKTKTIFLLVVICLISPACVMAASFEESVTTQFHPLSQGAIAWGDYDNDGRLDVAISGLDFTYEHGQRYFTKIYRNEGNGVFTDIGANLPGVRWGSLAWGDFNNDGRLDLAVTGAMFPLDRIARIYRNDGNGVFTDIEANLPGVYESSVVWGDFDNDGRLDLAVSGMTNEGTRITRVFRNEGNEVFTDINATLPGMYSGRIAWGDYNNDGYLDLAICGRSDSGPMASIYRNDKGIFSNSGISLLAVDYGAALSWGDFDNDGHLDLAVAGTSEWGRTARVYRNNGNGSFTLHAQPAGVDYGDIAWGDFDNDGDLDLIVIGLALWNVPSTKLYRNDNGTFVDTGLALGNLAYSSAAWGDYSSDGKIDLMLMGSTNNDPNHPTAVTRLFKNTGTTSNTPPTAPGNLQITYNEDTPVFSWSPGSDNETAAAGLSYNMRMGTTPGGIDVISGMANSTGSRMIPAMGLRKSNSWSFDGATPGVTYYWSVQSIDSAFTGSQWSAEHQVTLLKISGYITRANGDPVAGVSITANNGGGFTTTDSNGYYEILISRGWSGRIIPSKPLYLFDPARRTYDNLQDDHSNQDFTAIPPAWEPVNVDSPGFGHSDAGIGDFNNDGRLDILVIGNHVESGQINRRTRVYRNDGGGSFTGSTISTGYYGFVAWGDYNNNGYLDPVFSGIDTITTTGVFRNNGDETFVLTHYPVNVFGDVAWADFNNDGRQDLAVTGREGLYPYKYRLKVLRNNADSTWLTMDTGSYGYGSAALAWGDYDNDGDLDLIVSGTAEYNGLGSYIRQTRLYRNDGENGFAEIDPGIPGFDNCAIACGDYNNDGRLDLAISGLTQIGSTVYRVTRIYRNDGNGVFTDIGASLTGVTSGSLAWADFDNDGKLDLAVSGYSDSAPITKIYRNEGNGVFTDIGADLVGVSSGSLSWGDMDNDGRLDLLVTGVDALNRNVFTIYFNNYGPANTKPSPPTVLSETIDGMSVTFNWNAGNDAETPAAGLSYNLRVGTTPGGNDIFSGMADASGWRRVPATGNAQKMLSWKLNDLPPGIIYWSVQAIDTAFAGSTWAVERSFELLDTTVPVRVSDLKLLPDGSPIDIKAAVISASIPDYFYVQEDDRSSGIRVKRVGHSFSEGQRVDIEGSIATNTDGEREINATKITTNGTGEAVPLGMVNMAIGGGDWSHDPATGTGQGGIIGGQGMNNIGLLIRTWGKVTRVGSGFLYIDDGSGLRDGTLTSNQPNIGVRVICNPAGYMAGDYVKVTGISSCFQTGNGLGRRILTRKSGDMVLLAEL